MAQPRQPDVIASTRQRSCSLLRFVRTVRCMGRPQFIAVIFSADLRVGDAAYVTWIDPVQQWVRLVKVSLFGITVSPGSVAKAG